MTCGIYAITNKETGKMYIGQSVDIEKRWAQHVKYGNKTSYIDNALKKYGEDMFSLEILHKCSKKELDDEERKFINLYGTYNGGYNLTLGGEFKGIGNPNYNSEVIKKKSGENHHMWGKEHSEDMRKKISMSESESCNKTGFYRVSSCDREGYITYSYVYYENRQQKSISNKNLLKLKEEVLKKGLDWLILDENKAEHTLKENNNYLVESEHHKSNSTGFYNVSKHNNSQHKIGYYFNYKYTDENNNKKSVSSYDISLLKEKVLSKQLKWKITNKELSEITIRTNKLDIKKSIDTPHGNFGKKRDIIIKENNTGFYNVSKVHNEDMKIKYYFVYKYTDENNKKRRIYSKDIKKLKKKVLEKNLKWFISNIEKATNTISQNQKDLISEYKGSSRNTSGVNNLSIKHINGSIRYVYRYYTEDKKRKLMSSNNISKLKAKVTSKGLDWVIVDKDKAKANGVV